MSPKVARGRVNVELNQVFRAKEATTFAIRL